MVDLQVSLDMAASSLEEIADLTLDNMINCGSLSTDKKDQVKKNLQGEKRISIQPFFFQVKAAMLKKHRHQFEGLKKQHGSENGIGSDMSKIPLIRFDVLEELP